MSLKLHLNFLSQTQIISSVAVFNPTERLQQRASFSLIKLSASLCNAWLEMMVKNILIRSGLKNRMPTDYSSQWLLATKYKYSFARWEWVRDLNHLRNKMWYNWFSVTALIDIVLLCFTDWRPSHRNVFFIRLKITLVFLKDLPKASLLTITLLRFMGHTDFDFEWQD